MSFQLPPIPSYDQCMVEAAVGRVTARTSEDGHFTIFNYTQETSVTKDWNDVNRWCRGLIFDEHTKEAVAVPFFKFFTLGQMPEVTYEALISYGRPVRIANKEDGSLGIMFWDNYNGILRVSTRGSLDSEQAVWATAWVNNQFIDSSDKFDLGMMGWTHQFEVIYKENRIVVDYGDFEGLIGLARVNNVTGRVDYNLDVLPSHWRRVKTFDGLTLDEIMRQKDILTWNTEGWVLTYDNGLMVKIKVEEYKKVHAIRFAITPNTVLRLVQDGQDPLVAVIDLPDEFVDEIRVTMVKIEARYQELLAEFRDVCADGITQIPHRTRKENALWCLENVPRNFQSCFFYVVSGRGEEPRDILISKVTPDDIVS